MEFGLTLTSNLDKKSNWIHKLSDELKSFFQNKNYGNDVESFIIGVICVAPQFDQFFKQNKPAYRKKRIEKIIHGIPISIENYLEYDIKIDFNTFINAEEIEFRTLLAKEIMTSLNIVEGMKSKIKDFNLERFKIDLEDYFKEKELL